MFSQLGLLHNNWWPIEGEEYWEVETHHGAAMDTVSTFVYLLIFAVAHATTLGSSYSPVAVERMNTAPWHFATETQPNVHVLDFVLYFLDLAVQPFLSCLVVSLRTLDDFDRNKIGSEQEKSRPDFWLKFIC